MTRLPIPGSDDGTWGDILNTFLAQSHNTDGSLKNGAVGTNQLQDGTITAAKLAGGIPGSKFDSATQAQLATVGSVADGSITDAKISSSAGIARTKLASSIQTSLASADSSVQTVNGKTPTSGAVSLTATDVGSITQTVADNRYLNVVTGADNTGATDATSVIASAIASIPVAYSITGQPNKQALKGGGMIVIPPGVYTISSKLRLPSHAKIMGHGATLKASGTFSDDAMIETVPVTGQFAPDKVIIEGLNLDGNGVAKAGLSMYNSTESTFSDMYIYGCQYGITGSGCEYNTVRDVTVRDCTVRNVLLDGYPSNQELNITGSPTGGSFTITFNGQTTGPIGYADTAGQVQTALSALSTIGNGSVNVTGSNGAFVIVLTAVVHPTLMTTNSSLSGGSNPTASIIIGSLSAPTSSNHIFSRLYLQGAPVQIEFNNTSATTLVACSFQTSSLSDGSGVGIYCNNYNEGIKFIGPYFEKNGYEVDITSGSADTAFYGPHFTYDNGFPTRRFIRNAGTDTRVYSTSTPTGSLPGWNGSTAPYEQNSTSGNIFMYGYKRSPIGGTPSMFCDENGNPTDPDSSLTTNIQAMRQDPRQALTSYWRTQTFVSTTNASVIATRRTADSGARLLVSAQGDLSWGPGDGTFDVTLSRLASGQVGASNGALVAAPATIVTWAANTAYSQGQLVLSPVGAYYAGSQSLVQAVASFTSSSSFVAANWLLAGNLAGQLAAVQQTPVSASDTTLVSSGLVVNVAANSTYSFEALCFCDGTTTADIRHTFVSPAGSTIKWMLFGPDATSTGSPTAQSSPSVIQASGNTVSGGLIGAGTPVAMLLRGTLVTTSTTGTLQHRFSQQTTDGASPTILQSLSRLTVERIA